MTSPEGSQSDISSGGFELVDEDSPHENFICYQDDDWSIVLPSEAEAEIAAVDSELPVEQIVHLTAEHTSLLTASSRDSTRFADGSKPDLSFRQEVTPSSEIQDNRENLTFFPDHFDCEEDHHADFIEGEKDSLDLGESCFEKLSSVEGDVNDDSDLEDYINIKSLTEIAFNGMKSDSGEGSLDFQGFISNDVGGSSKEPLIEKTPSTAATNAAIEKMNSSELCAPLQGNDERMKKPKLKNVPTPRALVFDGDDIWDNSCLADSREDCESMDVTLGESDESLYKDVLPIESSRANRLGLESSEKTEIKSDAETNGLEKKLNVDEAVESETFAQFEFEKSCEVLIDAELVHDCDEMRLEQDDFPLLSMNRKDDKFSCRLRKRQHRKRSWKTCSFIY